MTDTHHGATVAIRQRVLDDVQPLAPLTIFAGIPGTGKSTLIRQLYLQMSTQKDRGAQKVLVDFPRRPMGAKNSVALAAAAVMQEIKPKESEVSRVAGLKRGHITLDELGELASTWVLPSEGIQVFLLNYEWQASPELEGLLIAWVQAGLDIVCSMVDPDGLVDRANHAGVVVRVVSDDELQFRGNEIAALAKSFGVEPTDELTRRVSELTAGNPWMASAVMLTFSGVTKVIVNQDNVQLRGATLPGGQQSMADARRDADQPRKGLRRIDSATLASGDLSAVHGVLQLRQADFAQFMESPQGRSSFVRTIVELITIPWVDLDALEEVRVDCSSVVTRLCSAGYGHMEFGDVPAGRFVWNEAIRAFFAQWKPLVERAAEVTRGRPTLVQDLIRWYVSRGRVDAALVLVERVSKPEYLEEFASTCFADLLGGPVGRNSQIRFPATLEEVLRYPSTAVVAAYGMRPLSQNEGSVAASLKALLPPLTSASKSSDPRESAHSCLSALVALSLLDRWDDGADLGPRALKALQLCQSKGLHTQRSLAKDYVLLGTLMLVRAKFDLARKALNHALALCDRTSSVGKLAARGMIALEGYFGETLMDEDFDRHALLRESLERSGSTRDRRESEVVISVAQAWLLMWDADYDRALGLMEDFVKRSPGELVIPIVAWTYGFSLLLNGRLEEGRVLYLEIDRQLKMMGLAPRASSSFVFVAVLSCVACGRMREAEEVASRRGGRNEEMDAFTRAVLALGSGRGSQESLIADVSSAGLYRSRRFQVLIGLIKACTSLHLSQSDEALGALLSVVTTSSPAEIDSACRFISRSDTVGLRDLAARSGQTAATELLGRSIDGPHLISGIDHVVDLSPAQIQVLKLAARGLGNKEIAQSLYLSVNTVKTHLRMINRSLGASDRAEAVEIARRYRLLTS